MNHYIGEENRKKQNTKYNICNVTNLIIIYFNLTILN